MAKLAVQPSIHWIALELRGDRGARGVHGRPGSAPVMVALVYISLRRMNVLLSHSFQCKQISLIQPDSGGWLAYSKAACSKTRLLAMERKELISDCFTLASEIRCMILKVKVYWSKSMQHLSQFVWLPLLTTSYHITACITTDSIAPPPLHFKKLFG